jgi:hypothetical protein
MATFLWDSRTDGVGQVAIAPGVIVRASVDDGAAILPGTCDTAPFDVDNMALCQGICGDCNLNTTGPEITDALVAAQIGVGLVTPSTPQTGCCDADSSGNIDVIDALRIAQGAAGLTVTLVCP